eukprot:GHRR01036961.1.p1 GENE.GHRR01036961.1~~GHRR01036961.1.p1  ORF type:complete len:230 (-),score=43.42 GHRR01036961.1:307-939(-)
MSLASRATRATPRVASGAVVRAAASRRNAVVVKAAAPLVGSQAPDFKATAVFDQEFVDISLSQYKGKYVVLFFYPLDFTFVCPTEITAFSDRFEEFKSTGAEVLGISVDSQFTHLAWIQTDRKEGESHHIVSFLCSLAVNSRYTKTQEQAQTLFYMNCMRIYWDPANRKEHAPNQSPADCQVLAWPRCCRCAIVSSCDSCCSAGSSNCFV